jgi:large subunit ribosomal protein L30
MTKKKMMTVKLVASPAKRIAAHKASVRGLGLRRIGHTVQVEDTACTRGMVKQVSYLVKVEE